MFNYLIISDITKYTNLKIYTGLEFCISTDTESQGLTFCSQQKTNDVIVQLLEEFYIDIKPISPGIIATYDLPEKYVFLHIPFEQDSEFDLSKSVQDKITRKYLDLLVNIVLGRLEHMPSEYVLGVIPKNINF